jgi:predicted Rossmann fold nucleotide-binding protein DprA/Smf involved in DNA uptake
MNLSGLKTLLPSDVGWPETVAVRLGKTAPRKLHMIGQMNLLGLRKTALFCSVRAPGDAILRAHDAAVQMRDEGVTVISGFHSPIEKECLRILLRGKQPIIICVARAMETIRLPSSWRTALDAGRLLIVSQFEKRPPRPTAESAQQRNELVAALADEVLIIHATPSGQIEQIARLADRWKLALAKTK